MQGNQQLKQWMIYAGLSVFWFWLIGSLQNSEFKTMILGFSIFFCFVSVIGKIFNLRWQHPFTSEQLSPVLPVVRPDIYIGYDELPLDPNKEYLVGDDGELIELLDTDEKRKHDAAL